MNPSAEENMGPGKYFSKFQLNNEIKIDFPLFMEQFNLFLV